MEHGAQPGPRASALFPGAGGRGRALRLEHRPGRTRLRSTEASALAYINFIWLLLLRPGHGTLILSAEGQPGS